MTELHDLILHNEGLSTAEWQAHFAVRRRMKLEPTLTDAELDRQLAALSDAGLVECVDGCWEAVLDRMPVGPRMLF